MGSISPRRDQLAMIAVVIALVGMTILVLALFLVLFLRKRFPQRTVTISLICMLLVSLLTNAGLLAYCIVKECSIGGDGQYGVSPNDLYIAHAFSLRPCMASQPPYYLFRIDSQRDGQCLKTVRIDPGETNVADRFRELPQIVHWSADSTEVTFRIPGVQMTIETKGLKSEE
jgi:hypothetical protein